MGQRYMPLMGEAYQPKHRKVSHVEIEQCDSPQDAIIVCRQNAPYRRDYKIAGLLEMGTTQFSRSLRGSMNFPPRDLDPLEDVCQNMAITQYFCNKHGILIPETEEERTIRELEEQAEEAQRRLDEAKKRIAA